jgi:hypothetical protein
VPDASRTLGLFRGVLEDGDARPVSGARISFDGGEEQATSGPDGTFGLHIPAGSGTAFLRVSDRTREYRLATSRDETDRARIVLVPPDGVPLRVLTPGSSPVPRHFGWQALRRTAHALEAGPVGEATAPRFAVRGLVPGRYALVVWAGPFLPIVVEGIEIDGALSLSLVTLELSRRGASVAGRVLSPQGEPRAGVLVTARGDGTGITLPPGRTTSRTDAGGRWRVEGLPAGRYTLTAEVGGGIPVAEMATTLLDREERSVDLVS